MIKIGRIFEYFMKMIQMPKNIYKDSHHHYIIGKLKQKLQYETFKHLLEWLTLFSFFLFLMTTPSSGKARKRAILSSHMLLVRL